MPPKGIFELSPTGMNGNVPTLPGLYFFAVMNVGVAGLVRASQTAMPCARPAITYPLRAWMPWIQFRLQYDSRNSLKLVASRSGGIDVSAGWISPHMVDGAGAAGKKHVSTPLSSMNGPVPLPRSQSVAALPEVAVPAAIAARRVSAGSRRREKDRIMGEAPAVIDRGCGDKSPGCRRPSSLSRATGACCRGLVRAALAAGFVAASEGRRRGRKRGPE